MNEGFQRKREYEERSHLETLRILRFNSYINYTSIPTKKGFKKDSITKLYPLPNDPKAEKLEFEDAKELFTRREKYITNGKLRGYRENGTNNLYNKEGILIAYIRKDIIEYIN